jgi:hypothetical protein
VFTTFNTWNSCIYHSRCSWSNVVGNGVPLRCLQSQQWSPNRNLKRTYLKLHKFWGFHGGDYEYYRLLGYKFSAHTSQDIHYISGTQPSRLMLCKILGFHGSNYEECRLLGHDIHYVSATEPSRLMLCKIWGFHGGNYEESRLLGYHPNNGGTTFLRNVCS